MRKLLLIFLTLGLMVVAKAQLPETGEGVLTTDKFPFSAEALDSWMILEVTHQDAAANNFKWDDRLIKIYSVIFMSDDMSRKFRMFVWRYDHDLTETEKPTRLSNHVKPYEVGNCQERQPWKKNGLAGFTGQCTSESGKVQTRFLAVAQGPYVVSLSHTAINETPDAELILMLNGFWDSVKFAVR